MALASRRIPAARAVGFEVALNRDHDEVILRVAEHASQRLGDSHHFVGISLHRDCLADGVHTGKEAIAQVVADEGYSARGAAPLQT